MGCCQSPHVSDRRRKLAFLPCCPKAAIGTVAANVRSVPLCGPWPLSACRTRSWMTSSRMLRAARLNLAKVRIGRRLPLQERTACLAAASLSVRDGLGTSILPQSDLGHFNGGRASGLAFHHDSQTKSPPTALRPAVPFISCRRHRK